jgi:hypothetical protein
VGIAKDARYLDFALDKPVGPFFFLPAGQHDFSTKDASEGSPSSHFLRDIVIVTERASQSRGCARRWLRWTPICRLFRFTH